jgi:hypothetical protein
VDIKRHNDFLLLWCGWTQYGPRRGFMQ